jgi:hypothetical protein
MIMIWGMIEPELLKMELSAQDKAVGCKSFNSRQIRAARGGKLEKIPHCLKTSKKKRNRVLLSRDFKLA